MMLNKNKTFFSFLVEMAELNNITRDNFSREQEFSKIINSEFMTLLVKDVDSQHNKIHQFGGGTFFLVSEEDEYLGHLELEENKITNSYSKINGFYKIMFSHILLHTNIKEIYSDISLSQAAINSYEKLSKSNLFKVLLLVNGKEEKFNKDELLNNLSTRVLIKENQFKIKWEMYIKRINSLSEGTTHPSFFRQKYLKKDVFLDEWLYNIK